MELGILHVLALLFLTVVGAQAHNHETEKYWQNVLPNAVIPKPLKNLITDGKIYFKAGLRSSASPIQRGNYGYSLKAHGTHSDMWQRLLKLNETIYFFERDLHQGKKMTLRFLSENPATFLPRQIADSVPFATAKLPQILNQFSLNPETKQAKEIKYTVWVCEQPGMKGERKHCATSLESMIDFAVSELGWDVKVLATEVEEGKTSTQKQSYRVVRMNKEGQDSVLCHKLYYGYAVYYCHKLEATRSYSVSLVGENGSKVKALAVCHADTSAWEPEFFF